MLAMWVLFKEQSVLCVLLSLVALWIYASWNDSVAESNFPMNRSSIFFCHKLQRQVDQIWRLTGPLIRLHTPHTSALFCKWEELAQINNQCLLFTYFIKHFQFTSINYHPFCPSQSYNSIWITRPEVFIALENFSQQHQKNQDSELLLIFKPKDKSGKRWKNVHHPIHN